MTIARAPMLVQARGLFVAMFDAMGQIPASAPALIYSPQALPATEPPWPFIALRQDSAGADGAADSERLTAAPSGPTSGVRTWTRVDIGIRAYAPDPAGLWRDLKGFARSSAGTVYIARAGFAVRNFGTVIVVRDEMDAAGARLRGDWTLTLAAPPSLYDYGAARLSRVQMQVVT